ncbi:putative Phosphoesterase PA-phosphatase-like protein [Candidatus Zixiibacteriota bacterium]|nr:putative Phosphoesterase PA-phosphatase-like protein [candidate division Zixibacteria bacterium]
MSKRPVYPFDIAIFAYVGILTILIFVFGRPLNLYYKPLLINLLVAAAVIGIILFLRETDRRPVLFFRILYPGLLFTIFYEQTGGLMRLFFPDFLDSRLTAFEISIFGADLSLWLDKNFINVWVTEILSFSYFSYYLMLPMFLLSFFFLKKYDEIKKALTAICITFFASFLLFYLYPIEGPRYFFAGQYIHKITGPIFRPLVDLAINSGAVHGGCMPSSHVAVALVILFFTMRNYPRTGWFLIPVNIGLAMGTVYGRFHYISDVVVGAIIGTTATLLTFKYYDKFTGAEKKAVVDRTESAKYVS